MSLQRALEPDARNFGPWTAAGHSPYDDTLEVLGKGDFLNRVYTFRNPRMESAIRVPPISLFIGYFASQRTGQTMHSPQNCLPGAGWTFDSQKYTTIQDINGKNYNVGEYVISNGDIRQFVIYWYQAHGRSVPNEYIAKGYMVTDAIRMNRTDGALVRVITQILPSESLTAAETRASTLRSRWPLSAAVYSKLNAGGTQVVSVPPQIKSNSMAVQHA